MIDLTTQRIGFDYILFGWYDGGAQVQVLGRGADHKIDEELKTNEGSYKVTNIFYYDTELWVLTARR
jgi:hypothetical protein